MEIVNEHSANRKFQTKRMKRTFLLHIFLALYNYCYCIVKNVLPTEVQILSALNLLNVTSTFRTVAKSVIIDLRAVFRT
jgi:hypothetical protein